MKYFLIVLTFIVGLETNACDVCGSFSMNGSGVYNLNTQHYFGISYDYGSTLFEDENMPEWSYKASRQVVSIFGAYAINSKYQLESVIPLEFNKRIYGQEIENNNSLGDIQIGLNRFLSVLSDSSLKLILKIGLATELPTGIYKNEIENFYLQTSSKSLDVIYKTSSALEWKKWNVLAEINYKHSTYTSLNYRVGNTLNSSLMTKYLIEGKNIQLLPQLGLNLDRKQFDTFNNFNQHGTKVSSLFIMYGIQIVKKNYISGVIIQNPIWYKTDEQGVKINSKLKLFLTKTF